MCFLAAHLYLGARGALLPSEFAVNLPRCSAYTLWVGYDSNVYAVSHVICCWNRKLLGSLRIIMNQSRHHEKMAERMSTVSALLVAFVMDMCICCNHFD